jgi:hypothetical protein
MPTLLPDPTIPVVAARHRRSFINVGAAEGSELARRRCHHSGRRIRADTER